MAFPFYFILFFSNFTADSHSFKIGPVGPQVCSSPLPGSSLPRRREDGNCNFISSGSGQAGRGNPARSNGLGQRERGRLVLEGEQSGYVGQLS